MKRSLLALAAALVLAFNTGTSTAGSHQGPVCFTNELTAYTNGLFVLQAMAAEQEKGEHQIQRLIGSRVLFQGNNWDRPRGKNADLNLGNGILLRVELKPPREVRRRHGGPIWIAEVVGVLNGFSWKERVLHVTARGEDWEPFFVR